MKAVKVYFPLGPRKHLNHNNLAKDSKESYVAYIKSLQKYFIESCEVDKDFKPHDKQFYPERAMYLALLQHYSVQIKKNEFASQKFFNLLKENASTLYKDDKQQNTLTKKKQEIFSYIKAIIFDFGSCNPVIESNASVDRFLKYSIRKLSGRQQPGFFQKMRSDFEKFKTQSIEKLQNLLGVSIKVLNFDKSSTLPENFKFDPEAVYLLYTNEIYYLLTSRPPVKAQFKTQTQITVQNLKSILNQNQQIQNYELFQIPNEVECCVCHERLSQLDTTMWNYSIYCVNCLIDPKIKTSQIPANIVEKFFKNRKEQYSNTKVKCPQCKYKKALPYYNPARKPKKFTCECKSMICIEHNCGINECFCYCQQCKASTIFLSKLQMNFCIECKTKKCLRCKQKKSKNFCKCICSKCLQINSIHHECSPKCHYCLNAVPNLKKCQCTLPICYGCYYLFLEQAQNAGKPYHCDFSEY